jgi:ABC-type sugar transport system permease subunit
MLAGLQSISVELYEAAKVDGANAVQSFLRITVPLMRRSILFMLVIGTMGSFRMFVEPYLITEGGPRDSSLTSGLYLYRQFHYVRMDRAAATSFILLIVLLAASLLVLRIGRPGSEEEGG